MVRAARALATSAIFVLGVTAPMTGVAEAVYGSAATFQWGPARGPVEGYAIYVERNGNGFPSIPEVTHQGNGNRRATITGSFGETIRVRVAAFNQRDGMGPYSEPSSYVTFLRPSTTSSAGSGSEDGDFDGDGRADVLFLEPGTGRTVSSQADGSGLTQRGASSALRNAVAEAVGDFDGDGDADVLWRTASGGHQIGETLGRGAIQLRSLASPRGASLVSSGDYDGDGRDDLLWRYAGTGNLEIWMMDGAFPEWIQGLGNPGGSWRVVASPDLDGNGHDDLLLRDGAGWVYAWFMHHGAVGSGGDIPNPGLEWSTLGTPDLDGDGLDDILWRHDDGTLYVWIMNGTSIQSSEELPNPGLEWRVRGSLDYDGDGSDDLFWENAFSDDAYLWLMEGSLLRESLRLEHPGPGWESVPPDVSFGR